MRKDVTRLEKKVKELGRKGTMSLPEHGSEHAESLSQPLGDRVSRVEEQSRQPVSPRPSFSQVLITNIKEPDTVWRYFQALIGPSRYMHFGQLLSPSRFGGTVVLTFEDPDAALEAIQYHGTDIRGHTYGVEEILYSDLDMLPPGNTRVLISGFSRSYTLSHAEEFLRRNLVPQGVKGPSIKFMFQWSDLEPVRSMILAEFDGRSLRGKGSQSFRQEGRRRVQREGWSHLRRKQNRLLRRWT